MSLGYPILQAVSAPSLDATVLYEFNPSPAQYAGHDDFTLGAPEWQGEPGGTGGQDGYRTASFTHYVDARLADVGGEFTKLARLMLASDGWLRVQLSAKSDSRWLRFYRSTPGAVSVEDLFVVEDGPKGLHGIPISLTCDPYLYGARVTLPAVTLANDPTAATNPMSCVLDAIAGDAPAPLRLAFDSVALPVTYGASLVSVLPNSSAGPVVFDIGTGDGWGAGADTGAAVTDADYIGGSYRSTTFATTEAMAMRLQSPALSMPSGRYLMLVRVVSQASSDQFDLSATVGNGGGITYDIALAATINSVVTGSGGPAWVLLGSVSVGNSRLPDDVTPGDTSVYVDLSAARLAGSGELHWDALAFVAVESADDAGRAASTLTVDPALAGFTPTTLDGDSEAVWHAAAPAEVLWGLAVTGQFPAVWPGVPNVLTFVRMLDDGAVSPDMVGLTINVTPSYRPRFLWPAP